MWLIEAHTSQEAPTSTSGSSSRCKAHYEKKNFDEYWKQKISVEDIHWFFL